MMPNYMWEQINEVLEVVMLLLPITVVLLIFILLICSIIFAIKFNKKHNNKLQKLEKCSNENRKHIEEQRKKHFSE